MTAIAQPSRPRVHAAPGAARRRVALYSHDTQGLGHIRRNITLAAALVVADPHTDVLLVTGAPEATTLPLPPHTDVVTLPTLHKDSSGRYAARTMSTPLADLLRMRATIIEAAVRSFAPDLFVVDKVPRGVDGELDAALAMLGATGTSVVLGLRDILDDPHTTRREWDAAGSTAAVRAHYDAVWVYGDADVYDPVVEYRLPPEVAAKVAFTGYLGQGRNGGTRARGCGGPRPLGGSADASRRPYVLCMVGGGQDGFELADDFAHSVLPDGVDGVVLTGPYMSRKVRQQLRQVARRRPDLEVLDFVTDTESLVDGAAAIVSMAGYNSVCEVLAAGRPTLLVPRVTPRVEQRIRAERLVSRGLVDMLLPDYATPERIARWIRRAVTTTPDPATRRVPVDMTGLARVPELARTLLAAPASAPHHRQELVDVAV